MERLQNAPPETPGHSMKRPLAIPQGDANEIIPGTPTEDRMSPQKRPKTTKPPESTKRLDVVRRHMQPPSQDTEVSFQPLVQDLEAEGQLSLQISPSIIVPYLKHTIKQVIQHILRQPDEFKGVPYAEAIEASGGVEAMTEELLKCIFDDIKKLQGEHITIDRLRQIRDNQLPHIAEYIQNSSGYLDFITDQRCGSYWRGYVGQSDELLRRIVDHINAIKQGQHDTLHYHVVWKGQGHRSANFIMLWKIVDSLAEDEVLLAVSNNVLEMVMCRIFQTLPPNTLERYSGARTQTEPYSTLGLNIVAPTLQSIPLSSSEKTGFISELTESPDPDIQE
ncbi:Hypothetical protein PENO1_094110 [Penicillium occitanis (nom. inval.)]|nr:Hypothetical protein PENO1_094110 [Penicillium occitanis (nom. inval.)]PCG97841.1 hypothetical protein PENOC_066170 [Penicillium occitanis (nom. inval.)]